MTSTGPWQGSTVAWTLLTCRYVEPLVSTLTTSRPIAAARTTPRIPTLPLTWMLGALVVAATSYGLLADGYRETPARELLGATLRGQDVLTLLSVPVLLIAMTRAHRGSLRAHPVALGLLVYLPYTYLMYVVVPYNDAFLLYVGIIGLGSYLVLDGLFRIDVHACRETFAAVPRRGIGWFLVVTGSMFGAMWLAQNLSVLPGGIPDGLFVYDVPSTVHVLDLAFVLPTVIAAGVLTLHTHPAGIVLATVVPVKMVTLGLALLAMNVGTAVAGNTTNPGEITTWATIATVSAALVVLVFHRAEREPRRWQKDSIWS